MLRLLVIVLLSSLGSPKFQERENAYRMLVKLNNTFDLRRDIAIGVSDVTSPEIRKRAALAITVYNCYPDQKDLNGLRLWHFGVETLSDGWWKALYEAGFPDDLCLESTEFWELVPVYETEAIRVLIRGWLENGLDRDGVDLAVKQAKRMMKLEKGIP